MLSVKWAKSKIEWQLKKEQEWELQGEGSMELEVEAEGALQTGTAIMHCSDWHTKRTRIELACNSQVLLFLSLFSCLVLLMDNLNA